MQWKRACGVLVGMMVVLWCSVELFAGVFTATIESVSVEKRTITVKIARKEKIETLDVRSSAVITIDSKAAALDDIEAGQTVSVTTNGVDEVTKLAVKTDAGKPAETKPSVEPKPKKPPVKKPSKKTDEEGEFTPGGNLPTDDDSGSGKTAPKSKTPAAKKKPGKEKEKEAADEPSFVIGEWPQFRGPNRDNISREPGLLAKWSDDGPPLAWKATGLGEGYSGVSMAKGKVYTMGNRNDEEFLLAFDAESGEELWAFKTGKAYHNGQGDGPRGTPTIDDDRVYALGANGDLVCVGAEQGDQVWHVNILEAFGANNIGWGICESVLIDGDHVICTPGGKKATFAALHKHTGKTAWRGIVPGQPQAAYSSMIAIETNGVKQYVNFVHTAVVGVKASDGKFLWQDQKSANGTANCSSPIFYDDGIFSASGYGTGGAYVKLAGNSSHVKATLAYDTKQMKNHHGGMAAVSGYLYGFDEGTLTCLELKSGKVKWQDRSVGKGSLTIADGMLYLRSEQGPLALAEATPDGYNETGRFNQSDRSDKPSWAHPVVAGGKFYLRDMDTLLAYDVKTEE
jgi:outer membrane protein assembly factor BamB